MSQPTGNEKRGRKASNKWSFKQSDGVKHTVTITVPELASYPEAKIREFAELGLRQAARMAFQLDFKRLEAKVGPNKEALEKAIQFFLKPPEKMKGKVKPAKDRQEAEEMALMQMSIMDPEATVFELPDTWTFGGEVVGEDEESE